MSEQNQQKPIEMEWYCSMWTISHSPVHAPMPLVNKDGQPIRSWPPKELEFICSDKSGLGYLARTGVVEPVEKYVRKVGGTHYVAYPPSIGYLSVYRLKEGETATEGDWSKLK